MVAQSEFQENVDVDRISGQVCLEVVRWGLEHDLGGVGTRRRLEQSDPEIGLSGSGEGIPAKLRVRDLGSD